MARSARTTKAPAKKASARKAPVRKPALDPESRELGKKLDQVLAKSRKVEAQLRAQYKRQLKTLKGKQTVAKKALAHLGRRGAAASAPMKSGLRKAWKDVESAVRQAMKRFRETP